MELIWKDLIKIGHPHLINDSLENDVLSRFFSNLPQMSDIYRSFKNCNKKMGSRYFFSPCVPLILSVFLSCARSVRNLGRTGHFENEIGFSQELLMKNDFFWSYYLGFDWSGWIALIKSKTLTRTVTSLFYLCFLLFMAKQNMYIWQNKIWIVQDVIFFRYEWRKFPQLEPQRGTR